MYIIINVSHLFFRIYNHTPVSLITVYIDLIIVIVDQGFYFLHAIKRKLVQRDIKM